MTLIAAGVGWAGTYVFLRLRRTFAARKGRMLRAQGWWSAENPLPRDANRLGHGCRKTTCADCAGGPSLRHTTTRRGALGASCIQQRPAPCESGQIGLRHKASITARGTSGRNLYQGVLQTLALHVAHDMSYRS